MVLGLLLSLYNLLTCNGEELKLKAAQELKEIEGVFEDYGLAVYFDDQMGDYALFPTTARRVEL